ncbi:hypothetical protein C6341_g23255 [Phytophthora cactorum]|nr:hypothetical protein C6341_g23255 [Phytophthora cactorum]
MLYETPMPGNESLALICNDDVIVAALNLVREAIVLLQNNGMRSDVRNERETSDKKSSRGYGLGANVHVTDTL